MSSLTTLGTLKIQGPPYSPHNLTAYVVKKEDRNFVHGVAWQALGNTLGVTAMASAFFTIAGLGQLLGELAFDAFRDKAHTTPGLLKQWGMDSAPAVAVLVTVSTVLNAAFFKGVASCYENSQYHLGPEYEVVIPSTYTTGAEHPVMGRPRPANLDFPAYPSYCSNNPAPAA